MKNLRLLSVGMLAVGLGVGSVQAQPSLTIDLGDPINDYISLGEFNQPGELEGWVSAGGGANPQMNVINGVLQITTTSGDPWFFRAGLADIPPEFTIVEVRLRRVGGTGAGWEMFYGTSEPENGGFSGARRLGYDIPEDLEYHLLQFDISAILNGYSLTDFRIDPGQGAGNIAEVDYVRVGTISPDSDNDGLPDTVETGTGVFAGPRDTGSDPNDADSDGDGVNDGIEVTLGADPNDASVFPVPSIQYPATVATYVVSEEIGANTPQVQVGTPTSFSVAPALPAGLTLDTATGVISGTPTAASPATEYTVTAALEGGGTATATLTLEVRNPYIEFAVDRYSFRPEQPIAPILPLVHGPAPTEFEIEPELPEGLFFEPTTGEISGAAVAYTPPMVFRVIASYDGFPDSVEELRLAVLEDPLVTVDPEEPLLSYYSYGEYEDQTDADSLTIRNSITPPTVADGALVIQTTGGDPYFGKAFDAGRDYRIMEWRMRVTAGSASPLRLYWAEAVAGRDNLSELTAYSVVDINPDGEYHVYRVDFTRALEGPFTIMRLDPGDGPDHAMEIDYIRFGGFDIALTASLQDDGALRISWPASAEGYSLESTAALPGTWAANNSPVQTDGAENYVILQPTEASGFYRLTR